MVNIAWFGFPLTQEHTVYACFDGIH